MAEVRITKVPPDQTTVDISIQFSNENVTPPVHQVDDEGNDINSDPPLKGEALELGKILKQGSLGDLEPNYMTDDGTGYADKKEQKVSKKIISLSDISLSGLARTEDEVILTYLRACRASVAVTEIVVKYKRVDPAKPRRQFSADMWLSNVQVTRASAELRKLEVTLTTAGNFDDSQL